MHAITAIAPQPRQPDRVMIGAGGLRFVVPVEAVSTMRLTIGRELSPGDVDTLLDAEKRLQVLDRAVRLLATRARSVRELRRRLLSAHEAEPHVDGAIAQLVERGTLDDEAYARALARSQMVGRGYAPRRLQAELARRGVARDVTDRAIEAVLAENAPAGDDGESVDLQLSATIERLACRKLRTLGSLDPAARSRRLYAFLARRGYDNDAIRRVMSKVLADGEPVPDSA